ncbi:MAG: type pilus assembly protein PilC [Candidatus Hydrogenedentes bacterium]|nr:type pilus assembly protein PilC [Candidatus Hydrogenedentota bacterium]
MLNTNRSRARRRDEFTRQLHAALRYGASLDAALEACAVAARDRETGALFADLRARVAGGAALSDTLEAYPKVFPELYRAIVRAGEDRGGVVEAFGLLTSHPLELPRWRTPVRPGRAMALVALGLALFLLSALYLCFAPMFAPIFAEFGASMPVPTQMVLDVSEFISRLNLIGVWLGAFLGLALWMTTGIWRRGQAWWYFGDWLASPMLRLRRRFHAPAVAQAGYAAGLLLKAGVAPSEAAGIAVRSTGNPILVRAVAEVERELARGRTLMDSLDETGLLPEEYYWLLDDAARHGSMAVTLLSVSETYDQRVRPFATDTITLFLWILAFGAGMAIPFTIVSFFLPIFSLGDAISAL